MTKINRSIALTAAAVALVASACGDSSEDSLEQLIESETGEDVEIDFDDDGGISVESEDGSFSIDEEGNVVIVDESGEVITGDIDAEDGGVTFESDDGSFSLDDEGNLEIVDESGEVITGEIDEEGESFEVSSEEGDVSFSAGEGIPDDWPAAVPQPEGVEVLSGASFSDETSQGVTVVGTVAGDLSAWLAGYSAELEAAGIPQAGSFDAGDGQVSSFHESSEWIVAIGGGPDAASGGSTVSITVSTAEG